MGKTKLIQFIISTVMGATLLAAGPAQATVRIQNGNACKAFLNDSQASSSAQGGTNNLDGNDALYTCPLLRMNATSTTGLNNLVLDYKQGPAGGGSCTAYSVEWTGSILKSVTKSLTATSNLATDVGWSNSLNVSSSFSSYVMVCTLNNLAWLRGIEYDEP